MRQYNLKMCKHYKFKNPLVYRQNEKRKVLKVEFSHLSFEVNKAIN